MTKLKDWSPESLANYAAARGLTIEQARDDIAEMERLTFASPYTGNAVSHGTQYELDRAKGKHEAIEAMRKASPKTFDAICQGNAPVVRFQCPERHHLAKVHVIIAGTAERPNWQLHALDHESPLDATEPGMYSATGERPCAWQDEPGAGLCGELFPVESFGQRTCRAHGAEVWEVAAMLSRGSFICEKCAAAPGRSTGKFDGTVEVLLGRYFFAAMRGARAVSVNGEPFPKGPASRQKMKC